MYSLWYLTAFALLLTEVIQSKHINHDKYSYRQTLTSSSTSNSVMDASDLLKELQEMGNLKDLKDKSAIRELLDIKDPDPTYLTVPQLITQHGYPVESHMAVTKDGYILTLHRIPHGKHEHQDKKSKTRRQPIFLQHGLLASSACWLLNMSDITPAYIFADHGYDVWLGNARGNEYSTAHMTLDTSSEEFWDFSWTEMGKYDIPAAIDLVLNQTQYEKLIYIGHSMGTSMFWAAMNEHPSYNEKIMVMFGLGPVAYVNHMSSPIRHFSSIASLLDGFAHLVGIYEFLPNNVIFKLWSKYMCTKLVIQEVVCEIGIFFLTGFDGGNFNLDLMPLVVSHLNSGTSLNTVNHFAQEYESGKFQKYDHGYRGNLKKYNQTTPPEYDLSLVTAPVMLMYGPDDWLADPQDAKRLAAELPPGARIEAVPYENFNHLDFLIGSNCKTLIYDKILRLIPYYVQQDSVNHLVKYMDRHDLRNKKLLKYLLRGI